MAMIEIDGITLVNVHEIDGCAGRVCILHSPTKHHMHTWPLHWRDDRGIFERICDHGVGHPDPDQFDYWDSLGDDDDSRGVHGCDGCCSASRQGVTYILLWIDCWNCASPIYQKVGTGDHTSEGVPILPATMGEGSAWTCQACSKVTVTGELAMMDAEDL